MASEDAKLAGGLGWLSISAPSEGTGDPGLQSEFQIGQGYVFQLSLKKKKD